MRRPRGLIIVGMARSRSVDAAITTARGQWSPSTSSSAPSSAQAARRDVTGSPRPAGCCSAPSERTSTRKSRRSPRRAVCDRRGAARDRRAGLRTCAAPGTSVSVEGGTATVRTDAGAYEAREVDGRRRMARREPAIADLTGSAPKRRPVHLTIVRPRLDAPALGAALAGHADAADVEISGSRSSPTTDRCGSFERWGARGAKRRVAPRALPDRRCAAARHQPVLLEAAAPGARGDRALG